MKTVSKMSFLRCGAAPIAVGIALVASASGAIAQTVADTAPVSSAPASDNAADTIIVTGSRIARPQIEQSVPVGVITAESIQNAGQTNLLDALRDLPITGQSADRSASNFNNSGNGESTVNLRNLGPARTLVLINGLRSVGVPGSSAVDLNNIPTDLIDKVEIVTGGASAVYGSDAVAGVVNITLKNNYTGIDLHAQNMITDKGDGFSTLLSALAGKDFADGKGHIVANFTYTKEDAVPSSARSYSAVDSPTGSSYTPQGIFFDAAGDSFTFDNNNNIGPYTGAASQRFNRAADRLLTTPVERYSGSLLAHYDFSPAATLYAEAMYDKVKASGMIEPLAVDDNGVQGGSVYTFEGSPAYPGIPVNNLDSGLTPNPFVPPAIAAAANAAAIAAANAASIAAGGGPVTGPVPSFLDFRKRSTGIFDRSPHDDRDYYRAVIGLRGDVGSGWKYDLSYEHSKVRDDTRNGAILMTNYGAALQATTVGGQIVCADPIAQAAGCVPINPFGHQAYTAAQLNFLSTYTGQGVVIPGATVGQHVDADFLQKNYQDVATLAITGHLFNLPNGPLGVSFGGEYHREKVSEVFDPFTISGYSSQQLNGDEYGKYNSKEAFVELNAPIFGGHPWFYDVSLQGAARYAHYSTVGGVWTYKYGGTYAPARDISFHAIYARAVRAPNLNELYSPTANTAQQVVDPCDQAQGLGETATTTIPLAAGCTAIAGIANYLKTHPNFSYTLAQVQTVFGLVGGNPHLSAEATNTFTAGANLTPKFMRNFVLTADYYTIKVKNAVATVDPQTAVNECFLTGSANFCNLVHRDSNGFITEVDGVDINASSYHVAGIDVQAFYSFKTNIFTRGEKVNLDVYYNHKLKQEQTPFAGGPLSNELGKADTYASQQLGTGFKDQFTFNLNYVTGPVKFSYRLKYLGPVSANSDGSGPFTSIPAYTYHDLQVNFDLSKQFEFYVGCNNLLDKQPPFISGGDSQWPGTNTVADTYDLLGRTLYAGVHARF